MKGEKGGIIMTNENLGLPDNALGSFHLFFLLKLTKYLGFYPDTSSFDYQAFNLSEGEFTNENLSKYSIRGKELSLFKRLLGINFDGIENIAFTRKERKDVLRILTSYMVYMTLL